MKPLIIESDIGASVKTTHDRLSSYDYIARRTCIYPYTGTTKNGEYFIIKIPQLICYKLLIKEILNLLINSTNVTVEINLLKYIINKLY